ncbi:MAG TPA: serine/threonine-protein kinase [Gemmatimonadales bacterium]|nr:serine/threonine-protein kinase [Gemmatimonadales bacterium]
MHRDIKPENILLTKDGSTLVADFGIARALGADEGLTQTGMALGTPACMSPEQASGDKGLDARTDVYSLGAVLYELLTGEPPYTGATAQQIIVKRFNDPVPSVRRVRPSVPDAIDHAIQRALAPIPADRFATAGQLAQALQTGGRPGLFPLRDSPRNARRRHRCPCRLRAPADSPRESVRPTWC